MELNFRLNNYQQDAVSRADYFDLLRIYTKSHRLRLDDGRTVPWIDENLNPQTGDWIARTRLEGLEERHLGRAARAARSAARTTTTPRTATS